MKGCYLQFEKPLDLLMVRIYCPIIKKNTLTYTKSSQIITKPYFTDHSVDKSIDMCQKNNAVK